MGGGPVGLAGAGRSATDGLRTLPPGRLGSFRGFEDQPVEPERFAH